MLQEQLPDYQIPGKTFALVLAGICKFEIAPDCVKHKNCKVFWALPSARAVRCIFFPKNDAAAIANVAIPVIRFAVAHQITGHTASAIPPFSTRTVQIGPYRFAIPADFTRPPAG